MKVISILLWICVGMLIFLGTNWISERVIKSKYAFHYEKELNLTNDYFIEESLKKCYKRNFFDECDCVSNIIKYNYKYNYTPVYYGAKYLFTFGGDGEDYARFFVDLMPYEGGLIYLPLEPRGVSSTHHRVIAYVYTTEGYCLMDANDKGRVELIKLKYEENPYANVFNLNKTK